MVAINLACLEMRLSGGASNTDPAASLGGIMSSERLRSQSTTALSVITGVIIQDAAKNPLGTGTLSYNSTTHMMTWAAQAQGNGTAVDINADGRYVIPAATDGYLCIQVTASSLPGSTVQETVTIANLANELLDDITKSESFFGDIEYRCLYVTNTPATESFFSVKALIGTQPSGADDLALGLDPAGVGNGSTTGVATTIANESTAPSGVTFTVPLVIGDALLCGSPLAPSEARALWVKRIVPADTTVAAPTDLSGIDFELKY